MRTANDIAAEVAARIQAEQDESLSAAIEGAQKLTRLREALESLDDDFDCTFDDGPESEERSLWVQQSGRLIATWTRRGSTLVFQPENSRQPPRETPDLEHAVATTVEFLMRRRRDSRRVSGEERTDLSRW